MVETPAQPLPARFVDWFADARDDDTFLRGASSSTLISYGRLRAILSSAPVFAANRVAVLIAQHESIATALALLAVFSQHKAVAPLDPRSVALDDIVSSARELRTRAIIVSRALLDAAALDVAALHGAFAHVYVVDAQLNWLEQSTRATAAAAPDDEPCDIALLLRTSGTTATQKVVPTTFGALYFNARCMAASLALSRGDCGLNAMPLYHMGAIACALLGTLVGGGAALVFVEGSFDAAAFLRRLQRGEPRVTWYYAAPTFHKALLLHARAAQLPQPLRTSLRLVRSGAAHLPHDDALQLQRLFGARVAIMPTYSMTECMPICSVALDHRLAAPRVDTCGRSISPSLRVVADAAADAAVALDDAVARPLPYGATGAVVVRGVGVTLGYEGGAARAPSQWLVTGDRGHMDRDGYVYLAGRAKDVVKRGGEQVSLAEVDAALLRNAAVDVCVSFPVPNPFWGEEVAACVVVNDASVDAQRLLAFARSQLRSEHTWPRQLVVLTDASALPKTASGKYLRRAMAARFDVRAVDLAAERLVAQTPTSTAAVAATADYSALRGLRPLLSALVLARHFCADHVLVNALLFNGVTCFVFLAGFLLAAATTRALSAADARRFVAARLAALHGMYLLSLLVALPPFFARCMPGGPAHVSGCSVLFHHALPSDARVFGALVAASLLVHATGLGKYTRSPLIINLPSWFQALYAELLLAFAAIDARARRASLDTLRVAAGALLLVAVAAPSVGARLFVPRHAHAHDRADAVLARYASRAPLGYDTSLFAAACAQLSWLALFAVGVVAQHAVAKGGGARCAARLARLVDVLTAAYAALIGVLWLRWLGADASLVVALSFGHSRVGVGLFAVVYLTALAASVANGAHSYTSRALSARWLVRLSPLAYAVYLLHYPLADCAAWALGVGAKSQLPVLSWPLIYAASLALGHAYNTALNPLLMPFFLRAWRFVLHVDDDDKTADSNVVFATIRQLTGAVVDRQTLLTNIGLDSFGTTALVGALRVHAPHLQLSHFIQFKMVGDVVDFLK